MKVAALDLGSNTFLCLIAEVDSGRIVEVISDEVEMVRLGQGLGQGATEFHPEALHRAELCLQKFAKSIQRYQPDFVLAMATAAARDVKNADRLIEIGAHLGIPIEIIPGEREVEITFQGAVSGQTIKEQRIGVLDIGGGSTELIVGSSGKILQGHSFPFGCVKLTEKYFQQQPSLPEQRKRLAKMVHEQFSKELSQWPKEQWPEHLLAVAGTPTELARVHLGGGEFDPAKIDGVHMSAEELEAWIFKLAPLTPAEVQQKLGIHPGRADVLLSGVILLREMIRCLGLKEIVVSTRGVRYGVALELERRQRGV